MHTHGHTDTHTHIYINIYMYTYVIHILCTYGAIWGHMGRRAPAELELALGLGDPNHWLQGGSSGEAAGVGDRK